jgi:hypothetical protein
MSAELQLTPTVYSPQLNGHGEFVDMPVPVFTQGIRCPCSKTGYFKTTSAFSKHQKSNRHDKWMKHLNDNKQTVLEEKTQLEETVQVQKLTIARFDIELQALKLKMDQLLSVKTTNATVVPKTLRSIVWNRYIGADIPQHKCFCCWSKTITMFDFQTGHVKSQKEGGSSEVENLRPICSTCNLSMGAKNMIVFMKEHNMFL